MPAFSKSAWRGAQSAAAQADYLERIIGPKWNDLRFPATAINPPGTVSDPDVDSSDGLLLFDKSGVETIFIAAQLPHGWDPAAGLKPHLHWCKTTSASGVVVWGLKYRYASIGQTFSPWTTDWLLSTQPVSDQDTADHHAISAFALPLLRGRPSMMLLCQVARLGSSEDDTYGADAKLLEFDIHYRSGTAGTTQEFSD